MSLLVQLHKAHGGSGADAERGAQHRQGPQGGKCLPSQAVNGRSCMGEVLSVLDAPLICVSCLDVLLTVSCSLSTIISSPCLLLLSLLKPCHRPFYTPGKSNRAHPEVGERLVWGTKPTVFIPSGNDHLSSSPQRRAAHRPPRARHPECWTLYIHGLRGFCNLCRVFQLLTTPQRYFFALKYKSP